MPDPTNANLTDGMKIACDVELADIIERVESSSFLGAMRFEPGIHANYAFTELLIQQCKDANNCNRTTAKILLSMSFGLYQIMGFNLYHPQTCGFHGSIGEFLSNKSYQRQMLKAFLTSAHVGYSARDMLNVVKRENFARKYNGPGNVQEYSAKILTATNALGIV